MNGHHRTLLALFALLVTDSDSSKWNSSSCDFTNFLGECVQCYLHFFNFGPADNTIVRTPPGPPRNVNVYLYETTQRNRSDVNNPAFQGIVVVILQPYGTQSLEAYYVLVDISQEIDGEKYLGGQYHFEVSFKQLHYDDRSLRVSRENAATLS